MADADAGVALSNSSAISRRRPPRLSQSLRCPCVSLAVRDLSNLIKPDDMVTSEHLVTLLSIVPKYSQKDWLASYESLDAFVVVSCSDPTSQLQVLASSGQNVPYPGFVGRVACEVGFFWSSLEVEGDEPVRELYRYSSWRSAAVGGYLLLVASCCCWQAAAVGDLLVKMNLLSACCSWGSAPAICL